MNVKARTKIALAVPLAASFAAVALGVAAPPGASGNAKAYFYVGGHTFGLGEAQVYVIDRESLLTVRYRDKNGQVQSKLFHYHAQSSVAWTIEGIASGGGAVLSVATAAPTPSGSASPPAPSAPTGGASPQAPPASPILDARGEGRAPAGSALAEVAPLSILLSSVAGELPAIGKPWKSTGDVRLAYGTMTVALDNVITSAVGNQDTNIVQIASTGTTGFQAKVKVPGFGSSTLRGSGSASATSFLESQNKLLLGMSLTAGSHGNAAANDRQGSYELSVKMAIKLVKYIPGIPAYSGSPGFVPASGYLGGTTMPDSQIYSTALPNKMAIPAATDTGFIPPPAVGTPYQSALPAMSLPPIPLPMASDQPVASPPAGPTPTPQPTHY